MSGYLMEPVLYNEDFKVAVRTIIFLQNYDVQRSQQSGRIFFNVMKSSLSLIGFNRYPDM